MLRYLRQAAAGEVMCSLANFKFKFDILFPLIESRSPNSIGDVKTSGGPTVISDLLGNALLSKGWTIKEAAEQAGVERSFLSRLVSGRAVPPKTKVGRKLADKDPRYRQIAEALGLDVEAFLDQVIRLQQGESPYTESTPQKLVSASWNAVKNDPKARSISADLSSLIQCVVEAGTHDDRADRAKRSIQARFQRLPSQSLSRERSPLRIESLQSRQMSFAGAHRLADATSAMATALREEDAPVGDARAAGSEAWEPPGEAEITQQEMASLLRCIGDTLMNPEDASEEIRASVQRTLEGIHVQARVQVASLFFALANRHLPTIQDAMQALKG